MFEPVSELVRHQKYLPAFKVKSIQHYYDIMSRFIMDPEISYDNGDDMDLFINFVFDSDFGYVHNSYCKHLLSTNSELTFTLVCNFLNYLYKDCELFVYDFFFTLAKDYNPTIVEKVFEQLQPHLKLKLLDTVCKFPEILKGSSRLKLYVVFS